MKFIHFLPVFFDKICKKGLGLPTIEFNGLNLTKKRRYRLVRCLQTRLRKCGRSWIMIRIRIHSVNNRNECNLLKKIETSSASQRTINVPCVL